MKNRLNATRLLSRYNPFHTASASRRAAGGILKIEGSFSSKKMKKNGECGQTVIFVFPMIREQTIKNHDRIVIVD